MAGAEEEIRLRSRPRCSRRTSLTKYFVVGDSLGRVFVFSAAGDTLLKLGVPPPGGGPGLPVTALLAYLSPRCADCLLFAGDADGSITAHRVTESSPHGDDWLTLAASSPRLLVRGLNGAPVLNLEAHHAGRSRYVLSCDAGRRIRVFPENGTRPSPARTGLFLCPTSGGSEMLTEKPRWVRHDGLQIFSIDIQPSGLRFATGGGDQKVRIWNMKSVRKDNQNDDSNQRLLATMCHHFGSVNCVRWAKNGRYLASGSDDQAILIREWKAGSGTSEFGSGEPADIENWKVIMTLRGHTADVVDLNWSPNDSKLASGSLDNTVHI